MTAIALKKSKNDNINNILKIIRKRLVESSDEKRKKSGQRFFKENIKLYGINTAIVQKISKEFFLTIKDYDKKEIFKLCDELWKSGYIEESFIACHWSYYIRKRYTEDDFLIFERWIKIYVNNWASCDTLCNHTIGEFIEQYPKYLSELKKWTKSENRWVRRASAVSLIIPAKRGKFLKDIFEISDSLLLDDDDLVEKGYGWMLKAASQADKKNEKMIFNYIMKNKDIMPRTSLRYAIEKMPESLKKKAMEK